MNKLSGYDRQWLRDHLTNFLQHGGQVSQHNYRRVTFWLDGLTMEQIGIEEGITTSAVSQSIRKVYADIKNFTKE